MARTSSSGNDENMIQRLMTKITEQAQELTLLSTELRQSQSIIENLENKSKLLSHNNNNNHSNQQNSLNESNYLTTSTTISKEAQKKRLEKEHKDQLYALERQLAIAQHRLDEVTKQKNQLIIENEKLTREAKFHEKCSTDLSHDVQKLRVQLESAHRKLGINDKSSSTSSNRPLNLFEEMKLMKTHYKQCELERNSLFNECNELKLKNKVLEDALEFRVDEIGLSGHADLLTKLSTLKGEIAALKKDLTKKNYLVENLSQEKSLIQSDHENLQHQVTQLQHNLMETKQDLNRSKQLLNIPINQIKSNGTIGGGGVSGQGGGGAEPVVEMTNALDQIKSLEQERDLLIEFIQTDMQKSSSLQTELMELKLQSKSVVEDKERLERQLATVTEKIKTKSTKYEELSNKFMKIESELLVVDRERNEYRIISEKREEEIHQLYEMNTKLSNQVSEYETKLERLERESHQIKADNHNQSLTLGVLTKDSEIWKERYEETEKQHYQAMTELQELKPRLFGLESEYKRLLSDHDRLVKERESNLSHLTGYQEYTQLKHDLTNELEAIREFIHLKEFPYEERSHPSPSSSTRKKIKQQGKKTTESRSNHSSTIQIRNLVEKHGLWCGIPSLRVLHPTVGEYIRILYQDLHDTYTSLHHLQEKYQQVSEEQKRISSNFQQLQTENLSYSEKYLHVEEEERRKEALVGELSRMSDEIRSIMVSSIQLMEKQNQDTLRLSLSSGPLSQFSTNEKSRYHSKPSQGMSDEGGSENHNEEEDRDHDDGDEDEPEPYEPMESEGSQDEGGGRGGGKGYAKQHRRGGRRDYQTLRDDEIQLEDLLEVDLSPSQDNNNNRQQRQRQQHPNRDSLFEHISSPIGKRSLNQETTESPKNGKFDSLYHVPVSQLPSLLSQLLIHNITLANTHPHLKQELHQLQQTNSILLQKNSSTHAMNSGLQQSIRHTQEQVAILNYTKQSTEEELRQQNEEATELVEKQNALIVTLEAKLTEMRRKMLLKGSQVTSLQQREITMSKKLYQTLLYVYENLTIHFSMTLPATITTTTIGTSSGVVGVGGGATNGTAGELGNITLPELLNITRSCFEDIIKWEENLKINQHSSSRAGPGPGPGVGFGSRQNQPQNSRNNQYHQEENYNKDDHEDDEEENRIWNLKINERSLERDREPTTSSSSSSTVMKRKPPTIPRR